jgi:hypothetical protein
VRALRPRPHERLLTALVTGSLGHLVAGVADALVLSLVLLRRRLRALLQRS